MLIKKKSTCVALCFNFLFCILFSQQSWSSVSLEGEPVDASLPFARAGEVVVRPMPVAIPEIALGYEEDYLRFINGKLIYKPNKDNDLGRVEFPFSSLSNPLEGTFDLSGCGDTGNYLSISIGYRKNEKAENRNKLEIWIVPKFIVEKNLITSARHLTPTMSLFSSPVGLFWTWGDWELNMYEYLVSESLGDFELENLYEKRRKRMDTCDAGEWWADVSAGCMYGPNSFLFGHEYKATRQSLNRLPNFSFHFERAGEEIVNSSSSNLVEMIGKTKEEDILSRSGKDASAFFMFGSEDVIPLIPRPLTLDISDVAHAYKDIYRRFISGQLIYKPNKDNDLGRIEIPFSSLSNPLEGTFDLSRCGDVGNYLSISTGYRKGKKEESKVKIEIWIVPKFIVEKDLITTARHLNPIMSSFASPIGLFWTWGGWENLSWYHYLIGRSFDKISSENLYENWIKSDERIDLSDWLRRSRMSDARRGEVFYLKF
jgi:hypothetical protein